MSTRNGLLAAVLAACLMPLTGCQTAYYRVTDTSTGRIYYASSETIQQEGMVLRFTDARTGEPRTIHQTYGMTVIPAASFHTAVGPGPEKVATVGPEG